MTASRRVLVIGLDGMPLTLLRELAKAGVMPYARRLLDHGTTAELRAPVPEISSTSWATFLTGANPARHGIYGFTDLRPGSYDVYFPNLADLQAPPLWEHAAARAMSTVCLNVPGTYPAPRIRGAVVSGFVAPVLDRAVQPPRLLPALRQLGYQIDVEVGDVAADPPAFIGRVRRALDARVRAFTQLLVSEPWELAVAVVTETDRLQHFLWSQLVDPDSALHESLADVYRAVDAAVAQLISCADDQTDIFIVSDHGFGPATCQFNVNAWLRSRGWLEGLDAAPALTALTGATRIFALDPARFYLHRKDRFPAGPLTSAEADELAAELAEALLALRWHAGAVGPAVDGPELISEVYRRDEIYHGPLAQHAPDVVAVPAAGVQLRGSWRAAALTSPDLLTGTHTRGNALFWTSRRDIAPGTVEMADVAPTVLGCLGVDPGGFDGADLRSSPGCPGPTLASRRFT